MDAPGSDAPTGREYEMFLIAAFAASVLAPSLSRRLARRMPRRLADTVVLGTLVAIADLALVLAERRRPFESSWNRIDAQSGADAAMLFVVTPIEGLLTKALAERLVPSWAPGRHRSLAPPLPLAGRLAGALAISELAHYWHHRLAHEVPLLWRFHSLHHRVDRLNWLNSTWFHPLDLMPLMLVQDLPLAVLGIDPDTALAHRTLKMIHGQLQHANLVGSAPTPGSVFSTTAHHRRHHAADRAIGRANYGAVLSLWDRAFGTLGEPCIARADEIGYPEGSAIPLH